MPLREERGSTGLPSLSTFSSRPASQAATSSLLIRWLLQGVLHVSERDKDAVGVSRVKDVTAIIGARQDCPRPGSPAIV